MSLPVCARVPLRRTSTNSQGLWFPGRTLEFAEKPGRVVSLSYSGIYKGAMATDAPGVLGRGGVVVLAEHRCGCVCVHGLVLYTQVFKQSRYCTLPCSQVCMCIADD